MRPHRVSYLPPDTGEHTPWQPQPGRPVLDLPTLVGWKAGLSCVHSDSRWFVVAHNGLHGWLGVMTVGRWTYVQVTIRWLVLGWVTDQLSR